MDYNFLILILLILIGIVAGLVNTVAGGGSNLTLPVLMMLGLPADVANATNRVGILLQCVVGIKGFNKHNYLDTPAIIPILIPTMLGGACGAILVSLIPPPSLKPVLLGSILLLSFIILIKPSILSPELNTTPYRLNQRPSAWCILFITGVYGGFVQAGVGFLLIIALTGGLRYDLVRANSLKLVCILSFTSIALIIFIYQDKVLWLPGFVLAIGAMFGSHIGVKISIKAKQSTLKWFLFLMTLFTCVAAMWLKPVT